MPINHTRTCRQHLSRIAEKDGKNGDPLLHCSDCHHYEVLREAKDRPAVDESEAAQPRTLYFCRAHYNPVTFQGRGCRECGAEKCKRQTPKRRPDGDDNDYRRRIK
ncbi:hypothetical protein [Tessaracoccus palaemonis]|uniref:Uncharacterized protein n=1 Tax=Tessaracoccus palaemonis TaxID=2829499 RepID=A0ABX8SLY2_9ACTN|nr:hypothetical protein [Tessaracoccus palaemonis]QXT63168.1 hypothetical protein KDB89_01390 [Tessaracoccus palaemonis]